MKIKLNKLLDQNQQIVGLFGNFTPEVSGRMVDWAGGLASLVVMHSDTLKIEQLNL